MYADEYEQLIEDPSDFWARYYLPRVFGALEPWSKRAPFSELIEMPMMGGFMVAMGLPDMQESFKTLLEAGQAALEWFSAASAIDAGITATYGLPALFGSFSKVPFDTLADTLRGTRPIMLDMYRRPEKLKAAMERLVPLMVQMGVRGAEASGIPLVMLPLHKGADGFMSNDAYAEFYWPPFKAVLLGLIEEGIVPVLFVEGGYNERLEFLVDPELPRGSTVWMFDKTDMKKVKEVVGGVQAFTGNVPVSLLKAGTPAKVREYVKDLIDNVATDGGYMLTTGGAVDNAQAENYKAMIDAGLEYGKY
jgi:uroporphyrinogen-III decarboxylase